MKQTVTINLAGIVYHIDDDAYEILNSYLKSIEEHLGASDSKEEIMLDIEARIAELFDEHMKYGHVEVANLAIVNDIIAQLGSPEMITSGEEAADAEETKADANATAEEAPKSQYFQTLRKKKFYRDTDHQAIGGVCSGLAQFIGIDTVWVRLAMVLLFFLQGVGLITYLLLWLIVPAANTAARRLEMKGIEPSADNIKTEVERQRESGEISTSSSNNGCLRGCLIAILAIFCFPIAIAFLCVAFGLLAGGFGALAGLLPVAGLLGISSGALGYVVLASFAAIVVFLLPIIVLIIWAIHRNKSREPMKRSFWITNGIIWVIALILMLLGGAKTFKAIDSLEGSDFEQKVEMFGEAIEAMFEGMDENGTIIINGDTISFNQAKQMLEEGTLSDSTLLENLEQLSAEFGDGASEGVLEVTEE